MNTDRELMQQALEALEGNCTNPSADPEQAANEDAAITALRERLAQPEKCQCPACKVTPHASDCAVHNAPAYPIGKCDCGAQPEQKPVACPDGKPCKHGAWCTETYCQEHCEFRASPQRKPLTMQERTSIVRANKSFHDKNEIDAYGVIDDVEAAHGIKE